MGGWKKTNSVLRHFFKANRKDWFWASPISVSTEKSERLILNAKAATFRPIPNWCNLQPVWSWLSDSSRIQKATNKTVEGLGLPKNTMQNRSLLTSEWTAKVFPGHFEFYHFIPLSTQPCGMLIARRAGGASEITLQRWRLRYAQRASRFNARCPELWLIAPGRCCNTSSALVKPFEAQRTRSLLRYTDLRCRGANVEGLVFFFFFFQAGNSAASLNLQNNLFRKKKSHPGWRTQGGWWWWSSLEVRIAWFCPERHPGSRRLPLSWREVESYGVLREQKHIKNTQIQNNI